MVFIDQFMTYSWHDKKRDVIVTQEELDRVVEVCKGIRYDGKIGLWSQKASGASKFGLGGRVYQEAYKGDWYSYDAAARKKGVSSYQFRAPGEWFAEVYSAFFMEKLPKAHPLHKWLTEQVQAPN